MQAFLWCITLVVLATSCVAAKQLQIEQQHVCDGYARADCTESKSGDKDIKAKRGFGGYGGGGFGGGGFGPGGYGGGGYGGGYEGGPGGYGGGAFGGGYGGRPGGYGGGGYGIPKPIPVPWHIPIPVHRPVPYLAPAPCKPVVHVGAQIASEPAAEPAVQPAAAPAANPTTPVKNNQKQLAKIKDLLLHALHGNNNQFLPGADFNYGHQVYKGEKDAQEGQEE